MRGSRGYRILHITEGIERSKGAITMFGNATVSIPTNGVTGPSETSGLSDELAIIIGRIAAMTLPDAFITILLEGGILVIIGCDELTGNVVIRRCNGYREYANNIMGGPII